MLEIFRGITPEGLAALLPSLRMGRPLEVSSMRKSPNPVELATRGWWVLPSNDEGAAQSCGPLADAIEQLVDRGLPAVAIYAFDDVWALGDTVRLAVSQSLGAPYVLVEDIWAFLVPRGEAGWPPHRGLSTLLDRNRPEYVNVWIALRDAELNRSCMHFLPLSADPSYPLDLTATSVPPESVEAAPVAAGTALVWNANTLHWGGRCDASAVGARVSCTFSLCREDAVGRMAVRPIEPNTLTPWERLDIIARQILIYGADQADVSCDVRAWAATTAAISQQMRPPRDP